ncbi:hypothetical protein F2P56_007463 [Juglans regia]|uniref:Uncharacterized protein n=1 Tax=Juglans regia TaxID=51240 RepID=A0A833Y4A3_JUGRE|nr:hypothetical protein F2P56_007463 [Juglans regia]
MHCQLKLHDPNSISSFSPPPPLVAIPSCQSPTPFLFLRRCFYHRPLYPMPILLLPLLSLQKLDDNLIRRNGLMDRNVQWVLLGSPGWEWEPSPAASLTFLANPASLTTISSPPAPSLNWFFCLVPDLFVGAHITLDSYYFSCRLALEEILEQAIGIDLVVNLKLQEDVLPKKCPQRRICSEFGKFQYGLH